MSNTEKLAWLWLVLFLLAWGGRVNSRRRTRMSRFEPELGQAAFTNTPWEMLRMEPALERTLLTIGDALKDADLVAENPCFNVGDEYENEVFAIRSYCWCDGEVRDHWSTGEPWGHADGCPPNFEWRDLRAAWYKHVGRGNSQNRPLKRGEVAEILSECLGSFA